MSELHPSNSETSVTCRKRTSFFPETFAKRCIALSLLVILLLMAFCLGYLVASNKVLFNKRVSLPNTSILSLFDNDFFNFFFEGLVFPVLGIGLGLYVLNLLVRTVWNLSIVWQIYIPWRPSPCMWTVLMGLGAVILAVCVLFADEGTNMAVVAAFCFFFIVYALTGPPLLLTMTILIFYAIGVAITEGAGTGMLVGILAVGLSMYPRGISIKRLICPKRGVM